MSDMRRLLFTTKLLFANSEACVANHHGFKLGDQYPGWLADCRKNIEIAEASLQLPDPAPDPHEATIARLSAELDAARVETERMLETWNKANHEANASMAAYEAELALTREALDLFTALDPDGARAVLAKIAKWT
jgi:hypothetical protein